MLHRTPMYALLGAVLCLLSPTLPVSSQEDGESRFRQSPVEIHTDEVYFTRLPKLKPAYSTRADLHVVNTGSPDEHSTVRAEVAPGTAALRIGQKPYFLHQFHWHTPSEHRIDGEEWPLELHLVHQAADDSLAVLAVLIRVGKPRDQHPELTKIFEQLPTEPGGISQVSGFNLRKLLPARLTSYRYHGSLTTPPFAEDVTWVVLASPITVSPAQVAAFKALFPHGNSREPQPLHGRFVLTDVKRLRK